VLVLRPSREVRTNPNERFQVDALSAQTGVFAVPSAKCALGNDDSLGFVHSVNADQRGRNVCKRSAGEHRLYGPVTSRKLPPASRPHQPGALLQHERTALLVVNPARRPYAKERRRRGMGAGDRQRVAFDFMKHSSHRVLFAQRPPACDEDRSLASRGERRERRCSQHAQG
jgi:hypothetical protein